MTTDEVTDDQSMPERAFAVVGHETRLAILFELWKHRHPDDFIAQHPMAFAELRKAVGPRDGSQFNYHIKPLLNRFVHRVEDGYILRRAGERVVAAIFAGAFADGTVFDAVPSESPCPICGGETVYECNTDLTLGWLVIRCTECEGAFGGTGFDGALSLTESLSAIGSRSRNPEELYQARNVMVKHALMSPAEGVCPDCTGTMSVTRRVCRDHHVEPGRRCTSCDTIFEVMYTIVCDVCRGAIFMPSNRFLLTEPRVLVFLEEHDYDPWADWLWVELDLVHRQTVLSEDPFELEMILEVGGDRLVATLDDQGAVTTLQRDPR